MDKYSDNYYDRQYFLKQDTVPTQSVMINKMTAPLAHVYFKSMTPKLKVLAGLEPPMKGGGQDWYIPPTELLENRRVVLKPVQKEHLTKLGFEGISFLGEKLVEDHKKQLVKERLKLLENSDNEWKKTIVNRCRALWENASKEAAKENTIKIRRCFQDFTNIFGTSINNIERVLYAAARTEIERVRSEAHEEMTQKYQTLLKQQATMLYDAYTNKLENEKTRLKNQFLKDIENNYNTTTQKVHDMNLDKHVAIEKLRNYLECQNLACQVYVALREKEACEQDIAASKHEHEKKIKVLTEEIALKDYEIHIAKETEKKNVEFNNMWKRKICHVIKKFQLFVSYCLHSFPDHAEFFLKMEKLMMLQMNETAHNPSAESLFEREEVHYVPEPEKTPFFLFCDKGYRPIIDEKLCTKQTKSSVSQLPVVVVNKRLIYAACDNLSMFTDQVNQYIRGKRGDDADFKDDHDYRYDIPAKSTEEQRIYELKLESSLMQVLQRDMPNIHNVNTACCMCHLDYCFCSPFVARSEVYDEPSAAIQPSLAKVDSGPKIETRDGELHHQREPKWDSFIEFMKPQCRCKKTAKKTLKEHLPSYMRTTSTFAPPELLNYEPCSVATLKKLVKRSRGKRPAKPLQQTTKPLTKDVSTQFSDHQFDFLCTCFSDTKVDDIFSYTVRGSEMYRKIDHEPMLTASLSPSDLSINASSFATRRAYSLINILEDTPDLQEIFNRNDCSQATSNSKL